MKFWMVVFLLIIVGIFLFYPPVNTERLCYTNAESRLSVLNYDVGARGISKSTQCERNADILYTLETCIRDATKSSMIARYANNTIQGLVAVVRPYADTVWTLKAEHNTACDEFDRYRLP